jgi:hypothetical protein
MTSQTEQAMYQNVAAAQARLNDGALVRETLEWLWRVAYAAGVRQGQSPPAVTGKSDRVKRIEQADREGWRFGTPWLYLGDMARPGFRFRYGGVDQAGPNCEREAVTLPASQKGQRMQLADTGETVRIPGVCWTRAIAEEEASDK